MDIGQGWCHALELVIYVSERLAAFALADAVGGCCGIGHERNSTVHVHEIEEVHRPQPPDFGQGLIQLSIGEERASLVKNLLRLVAHHHHLIEIVPRIIEGVVAGCPTVLVERLPEAAVVPVAATGGNHRLVGGERVEVVDTADGALKPLAVGISADVVVQRSDCVEEEFVGGAVGSVCTDSVAWVLVEASDENR